MYVSLTFPLSKFPSRQAVKLCHPLQWVQADHCDTTLENLLNGTPASVYCTPCGLLLKSLHQPNEMNLYCTSVPCPVWMESTSTLEHDGCNTTQDTRAYREKDILERVLYWDTIQYCCPQRLNRDRELLCFTQAMPCSTGPQGHGAREPVSRQRRRGSWAAHRMVCQHTDRSSRANRGFTGVHGRRHEGISS